VWKKLHDAGKLTAAQNVFWEPRPPEELYDLRSDRDEVKNLAQSPEHQDVLRRLRQAERDWVLRVHDVGFLPEGEIHTRSQGSTPYEMGHDNGKYHLKNIFNDAELASSLKPEALPELKALLRDRDSAARWWAAQGLLMRGKAAVEEAKGELARALADDSPYVRIVAAEALGRYGSEGDLKKALPVLLGQASIKKSGLYVSAFALNALDELGPRAAPARAAIKALPVVDPAVSPRMKFYNERLVEHILTNFPGP
jgi:uncharacterized sulfatase